MTSTAVRHAARQSYATMIYRGLLGLAFLTAVFTNFPYNAPVIVIGYLAFNQAIAAIACGQTLIAANQSRIDDAAERKTRHAILLASEEKSGANFWLECDRRVQEEIGQLPEASHWTAQAGLVALGVAWRLALDVGTIVLARFLAELI